MNLAPVTLQHGERFGRLTVLEKVTSDKRGPRYRCGCECGYSRVIVKARQLMRGEVKSCGKCAAMHGTGHDRNLTTPCRQVP